MSYQSADGQIEPFRQICRVVTVFRNGQIRPGSGVLLGPTLVLTAAHNLVFEEGYAGISDNELSNEIRRVEVEQAYPAVLPGGVLVRSSKVIFFNSRGSFGTSDDIAVIVLPRPPSNFAFGLDRVAFPYGESPAVLAGYPISERTGAEGGTLMAGSGSAERLDRGLVAHTCECDMGHSGGPILLLDQGKQGTYSVAGIHVAGPSKWVDAFGRAVAVGLTSAHLGWLDSIEGKARHSFLTS